MVNGLLQNGSKDTLMQQKCLWRFSLKKNPDRKSHFKGELKRRDVKHHCWLNSDKHIKKKVEFGKELSKVWSRPWRAAGGLTAPSIRECVWGGGQKQLWCTKVPIQGEKKISPCVVTFEFWIKLWDPSQNSQSWIWEREIRFCECPLKVNWMEH